MAGNTLTGLIPTIYTALDVVSREQVGFIPAVAKNAKADAAAKDQTVTAPVAPEAKTEDIVPGPSAPNAGETELSARLNEPLENGAVIHIVPRLAGAKSGGVFQAVLGAAVMAVAIWMPGVGIMASNLLFSLGASMTLGPLNPKPPAHRQRITANRIPIFLHWITWLPRAMFCRFCTVKCAWGHAWFLRRSARQTKGMVVRLW